MYYGHAFLHIFAYDSVISIEVATSPHNLLISIRKEQKINVVGVIVCILCAKHLDKRLANIWSLAIYCEAFNELVTNLYEPKKIMQAFVVILVRV